MSLFDRFAETLETVIGGYGRTNPIVEAILSGSNSVNTTHVCSKDPPFSNRNKELYTVPHTSYRLLVCHLLTNFVT